MTEVEKEVRQIVEDMSAEFYKLRTPEERKTIPRLSKEVDHSCGYTPDLIADLVVLLCSGTVTTVLYKLISKWIDNRNGRKFRIKLPDGFEVEATQLKKKEFEDLVELLYEKYGTRDSQHRVTKHELKKRGIPFSNSLSSTIDTYKLLEQAYFSKLKEIEEKYKDSE